MSMKKKLSSLEDLGGLVYSTNPNEPLNQEENDESSPEMQTLEAHFEKKGRGGKTAVIIKGFKGSESALKVLAKELKSHCATGGAVKNREIIIQGDLRQKVTDFLVGKGHKVKRVGG